MLMKVKLITRKMLLRNFRSLKYWLESELALPVLYSSFRLPRWRNS